MLKNRLIRYGAVGVQPTTDGNTPTTGRQAKTGDAVVSQGHGKYFEAAGRGSIFAAGDQGVGIVVQVTITTTALLSLHNPIASKTRLSILKLSLAYFNGTLGSGSFYHGFNLPGTTLPTGGTALTARSTGIGYTAGTAAVGVAISGSTVTAGTVLYPFASSFAALASSAFPVGPCVEDVDGAIVLEPGGIYQVLGVFGAAGTSPKVSAGIVWEEIPIIGG